LIHARISGNPIPVGGREEEEHHGAPDDGIEPAPERIFLFRQQRQRTSSRLYRRGGIQDLGRRGQASRVKARQFEPGNFRDGCRNGNLSSLTNRFST
jgi:hypothetical protein